MIFGKYGEMILTNLENNYPFRKQELERQGKLEIKILEGEKHILELKEQIEKQIKENYKAPDTHEISVLAKYKEKFEKFSNKPVEVEDLGKKKLAYEIQGNTEGHYAIFKFYSNPENISEVERNYRIDESIMKFITVRQEMEVEQEPETMEDEDNMEM